MRDFSEIKLYICDIHSISENFQSIKFQHMGQLANRLADHIAREGLKSRIESYLTSNVPRTLYRYGRMISFGSPTKFVDG